MDAELVGSQGENGAERFHTGTEQAPEPTAASPASQVALTQSPGKPPLHPQKRNAGNDNPRETSLSRCLVYCRLRPENRKDYENGGTKMISLEQRRVVLKDERHYEFDGTFGQESTQEEIFQGVAVPCLDHAFRGFCAALMCYGQTGTGKTFTMCNTAENKEGIIPRSAKYLFEQIAKDSTQSYTVSGQFVQIYRDQLADLMTSDGRERVDIHHDSETGVSLTGCSVHELKTPKEFMRFYHEGNHRRVVTATAMNPESSRGHTAMIISIFGENPDDPSAGKRRGKITFIDLAGYERFSKTGISSANPIMKDEAKTINASLLALGHVVTALSQASRHIPWRNAKLTRILQDSVGGRSRTSIILTIGPSSDHLYETTNSLQFGLRAMAVKVASKVVVTVDYEKLSRKLQSLLDEREERINLLELQIASRDAERQELLDNYQRDRELLNRRYEEDFEKLTAAGASEEQFQKLRDVYNVEVQNLQEQQNEEIEYQEEVHSREIAQLIKEQEHQESKRRVEMRLAQERIIDDFQAKLNTARGGTNEELVQTLQELAEKDSILASRANDTARLHEHIDVLTQQIKEMGGVPVHEASFPETFLDVGQVEEIQKRLQAELDREHALSVDLRTQLDRLTHLSNVRMEDINALHHENDNLRGKLQEAGIEVDESTEVCRGINRNRANMIDAAELETLRLSMQADLNVLQAKNDELERELLRKDTGRHQPTMQLTARMRGPLNDSLSLQKGSTFSHLDLGVLASARDRIGQRTPPFKISMGAVHAHLASAGDGAHGGGGASPQDVANSSLADARANVFYDDEEDGSMNSSTVTSAVTDATVGGTKGAPMVAPLPLGAAVPPPEASSSETPAVPAFLRGKEREVESLLKVVYKQETQLAAARSALAHMEGEKNRLIQQVSNAGLVPEKPRPSQPVEGLALDDYMMFVRDVRSACNKVCMELLDAFISNVQDESAGGNPSVAASEVENWKVMKSVLEKELIEKDAQHGLKDAIFMDKCAVSDNLARMCAIFINQLESAGITPACQLPESFRDIGNEHIDQLREQIARRKELEDLVAENREEKMREQGRKESMLRAMDAERRYHASVLSDKERRNRELEEREQEALRRVSEMEKEVAEKQKKMEDTVLRATLETSNATAVLMDTQAELVRLKDREAGGFWSMVFNKILGSDDTETSYSKKEKRDAIAERRR